MTEPAPKDKSNVMHNKTNNMAAIPKTDFRKMHLHKKIKALDHVDQERRIILSKRKSPPHLS
jgi:hypothetical protein